MNTARFFDRQLTEDIKELLRVKRVTMEHVKAWATSEVISLYNDLYYHVCGTWQTSDIRPDDTITREHVHAWLENEINAWNRVNAWEAFNACMELGYISVCGRGYTLNVKPIYDKRISDGAEFLALALFDAV